MSELDDQLTAWEAALSKGRPDLADWPGLATAIAEAIERDDDGERDDAARRLVALREAIPDLPSGAPEEAEAYLAMIDERVLIAIEAIEQRGAQLPELFGDELDDLPQSRDE